jgi:hypothetical protein
LPSALNALAYYNAGVIAVNLKAVGLASDLAKFHQSLKYSFKSRYIIWQFFFKYSVSYSKQNISKDWWLNIFGAFWSFFQKNNISGHTGGGV